MEAQTLSTNPVSQDTRPVRLRIAGADLLLSGRFEQWMPLVMAGDPKGEAGVQLLLDVTSHARDAGGRRAPDLFSFTTSDVQAVSPHSYRAKGILRADGVTRTVEVLLHSPVGHTPFFMMTLPIDRAAFGALWTELEDRALVASALGQKELRPQAWLRAPELAAA